MSNPSLKPPPGYTAEELERDNPFNQWMYEDVDPEEEEDPEPGYCAACNGSGEGRYDGSRCSTCGGSGEEQFERDPDDFKEPDDYDCPI